MNDVKILFALILTPWLSFAASVKPPEASFYREFTNRIRKTGEFRVYMPDGRHQTVNYLATVVLPKRLRNFSTRPPMLSTDFCVPV